VIGSTTSAVDSQLKLATLQRSEAQDMLVRAVLLIDSLTERIDSLLADRAVSTPPPRP
jgi:hypothetical protein